MWRKILSKDFAERVLTSAITMTAANYTAKGIEKGIEKVFGAQDESDELDIVPGDPKAHLDADPVFDDA